MKVEIISLTEEEVAKRDYRDVLKITVDGKKVFWVSDGELEDANLSRDFNDCWKISRLMEKAYEAGKNGETFTIENEEVTCDELW